MSMSIDKPLSDGPRRGKPFRRGRGGRGGFEDAAALAAASSGAGPMRNARVKTASVQTALSPIANLGGNILPQGTTSSKIIISNLPEDVTEQQLREFFRSQVGPLRSVQLAYNAQGKSKGIATMVFGREGDAARAYQEYNQRLIDQRQPMKIEIVYDPLAQNKALNKPSMHERIGALPPGTTTTTTTTRPAQNNAPRGGGRGGRGRGRGGRRTGSSRPIKSAEDLDAEMEDYFKDTSNAPAATST